MRGQGDGQKDLRADLLCRGKQAEVRAFITGLNRILPLYQRITAVEFSAEPLPRNAMGKLLRR